ncbi:MAG: hypothetical protein ABSE75_01655 [Acidimicrobiales bacterium]
MQEWIVRSLVASGVIRAVNTSTTVRFVHNGSALPAARVVVVTVPIIILTGLWWLTKRRGT